MRTGSYNSRNNVVCAGGMIRCLKESDYFSRTDTVLLRAALESPEEWNEKESVWEISKLSLKN